MGGRAGGVSNGAQIHSLALQDSGQEWICVFGEARTKEENPERPNEYVQCHTACVHGRLGLHPAASGGRLGFYPERGLVEALFVHYKRLVQEILGYLRKRARKKAGAG